MKRFSIFILVTIMASLAVNGQKLQQKVKQPAGQVPVKIKTIPAEPENPPPPPPPPKAPAPPAPIVKGNTNETPEVSVYALTSVRVKIKTGNDNKEFPSKVSGRLMARSTPNNWRNYLQINLTNEMRVNSETEFGIELHGPPTPLTTFLTAGLQLTISYEPNFFADAWKIEGITLILEFRDQHGNLHPTMGNKTIAFPNAYGFLNSTYQNIVCITDAALTPITANIVRY